MGKAALTKGRIVEKAIEVSSLVGLDGLTIGNLASVLKLSKSGLYAHFDSKERLQLEVLQSASGQFLEEVVKPALKRPRGEPRLIALFDGWLNWSLNGPLPGGCLFVAAAVELDDQDGALRDALVAIQRGWLGVLAKASQLAIDEGHFAADVDPDQVAFELHGIMLSLHHQARLLRDPDAPSRAREAYAHLSQRARGEATAVRYQELLRRLEMQ